jgi:hypothetical protein
MRLNEESGSSFGVPHTHDFVRLPDIVRAGIYGLPVNLEREGNRRFDFIGFGVQGDAHHAGRAASQEKIRQLFGHCRFSFFEFPVCLCRVRSA